MEISEKIQIKALSPDICLPIILEKKIESNFSFRKNAIITFPFEIRKVYLMCTFEKYNFVKTFNVKKITCFFQSI